MFNSDFFPTPTEVIETMMAGISLKGKTILEPSAGSGNIVDWLKGQDPAVTVIACEKDDRLREIVKSKCKVIAEDFLTVQSQDISHVDLIVMNPPFSRDEQHILHAFDIAPDGCKIVALCNWQTIENDRTMRRRELKGIIETHGFATNLGDVFSTAERKTKVEIGLVQLQKQGASYESEFEGFFMYEDPEEEQRNGLMPYNFVRDLVNRYVAAIKIFDEQLDSAVRLNDTGMKRSASNALRETK
jgi:predicted RNA methylase